MKMNKVTDEKDATVQLVPHFCKIGLHLKYLLVSFFAFISYVHIIFHLNVNLKEEYIEQSELYKTRIKRRIFFVVARFCISYCPFSAFAFYFYLVCLFV